MCSVYFYAEQEPLHQEVMIITLDVFSVVYWPLFYRPQYFSNKFLWAIIASIGKHYELSFEQAE